MPGWIAAAGAVVGGLISSQGAKSAADTQANAQMNAAQIGKDEFNTITQQEQPWMQAGGGAQSQLNYLLGIGPNGQQQPMPSGGTGARYGGPGSQYGDGRGGPAGHGGMMVGGNSGAGGSNGASNSGGSAAGGYGSLLSPFTASMFKDYSPAYQFEKQQLQQGVLNGDSSSMGALSGAAQSDLAKQTGQFANESFNNAFNQYQTQQGNLYSRLAGISQLGQNAAANTGAQGVNLAGSIGQSVASAGAAQAAGQVGSANAWSGAIQSAVPWLQAGLGGSGGGGGDPLSMNPAG